MECRVKILLALIALCLSGCASANVDSWPFFYASPEPPDRPPTTEVMAPFFIHQSVDSTTQWSLLPLISVRNYRNIPVDESMQYDVPFFAPLALMTPLMRENPPQAKPGAASRTAHQFYALYPLIRHEVCEPQSRTWVLPLYYNMRNVNDDGGFWHIWALLPFFFGGDSTKYGGYFAFFPVGGELKDLFGRDKVVFVVFPLYTYAESGGRKSWHFPWPFIRYAKGDNRDMWYVWPLIGQIHRNDGSTRWFWLWPFFWYSDAPEKPKEKDDGNTVGFFPIYYRQNTDSMYRLNIIWPLFSYSYNKKTDRGDYVTPWPLVRIGNGKDYYRRQFWPFWGHIREQQVTRDYVLWPIYRSMHQDGELHKVDGLSWFILYRSIASTWQDEPARSSHENLLWPFWYYKRDGYGNTYFCTYELRGIPDPQGWDRFYAFIWRICEYEKLVQRTNPSDGIFRSTRVLWGMYRHDRDNRSNYLRVFPLFSSRRHDGKQESFEVLMGMFGYTEGGQKYRILFVPFSF